MGFVFFAQINKDTVSLLREHLDGFGRPEQGGIDVTLAQQLDQRGSWCGHEFDVVKKVDTIPLLCENRQKDKRRGAWSAKDAEFLAFEIVEGLYRGVLRHEDHVHRREHAVNHDQVFAFASRGGHRGESCKSDVDLSLCDHEVQIGRAEQFQFVGLQIELIQNAMSLHDEIDKALGSWNEAELESASR